MADPLPGPRPNWIPGHSRRHERTVELDSRWIPACQCGWAFYSSVRSLRIADRTHGFHLDRVHTAMTSTNELAAGSARNRAQGMGVGRAQGSSLE
jgi:hypothetical protein